MFDMGTILFTAVFLFVLGLVSTYFLGVDLPGIIVKIVYLLVVMGFYLYMIYFDESELIEGVQKWVHFFINVILPMALGEAVGDALAGLIKPRRPVL